MVLIELKKAEDSDKTLKILMTNGKFSMFPNDIFRIDENEKKTMNRIKKAKISFVTL